MAFEIREIDKITQAKCVLWDEKEAYDSNLRNAKPEFESQIH